MTPPDAASPALAPPAAADLVAVPCAVCGAAESVPAPLRVPVDDCNDVLHLPGGRSQWVVCARCGLVYQSPRPGPDAVARLYDGGDYHEVRGGVQEHYVAYSLRRSVAALDWALARIDGPGRALDIGCGIGGALVKLRDEGWDAVGIEPDPEMAEVARTRFDLDARVGMFDGTSFAGEAFDLAYSCHVWEHLADPLAVSRAAHALLAPRQGHLMIVVPTFRRATTLAWSCFTAPHTYMWTDVSLGNLLDQAGFDVVEHRYHGAADSELWLLARARPDAEGARHPLRHEPAERVRREIALVPLRAPLGLPRRFATHLRTLRGDPKDFTRRLYWWTRKRGARVRHTVLRR